MKKVLLSFFCATAMLCTSQFANAEVASATTTTNSGLTEDALQCAAMAVVIQAQCSIVPQPAFCVALIAQYALLCRNMRPNNGNQFKQGIDSLQ